jgi:single-strand DNA-binding protein
MSDFSDTITITGNLAADPELKRTQTGVAIATFRVGSQQRRFDRGTGAWVDTGTNWYAVSAYRGLADHVFASLRKGERVVVTGRLSLRPWQTETKRGLAVEIDADAVGHDLRFGTTTFVRDERRAGEASHDRSPGEWAVPGEEAWAAPGLAPGTGAGGAVAGEADADRHHLGAGPSAAGADDEPAPREVAVADAPF